MQKAQRQKSWQKGIWAEKIAALWLRIQGYHIVARRFKTPVGEIDLIASRKEITVFVEVKARSNITAGLEAVSGHQQKRIAKAAQYYISRRETKSIRFDVIVICPYRMPLHIKSAW